MVTTVVSTVHGTDTLSVDCLVYALLSSDLGWCAGWVEPRAGEEVGGRSSGCGLQEHPQETRQGKGSLQYNHNPMNGNRT